MNELYVFVTAIFVAYLWFVTVISLVPYFNKMFGWSGPIIVMPMTMILGLVVLILSIGTLPTLGFRL